MADNVLVGNESGQPNDYTVASDDDGTAQHQYVKLEYGADGTFTKVASGANALPVQGTVTANLAAGTNNIGDVDVLTVPTDPFGATADAASATGSISAKLRFIASTGIPITGTVTVGSHAVTNAGTFAVQDSEKVADNAAFTDGTTKVQPAGYIFDEVAGTALTENDAAAARIDSKRAQVGVIEDATTRGRRATVSAGGALLTDASATTQPVSGTVAISTIAGAITPGTAATSLGKAEDAIHASGDVGVMALGVANDAQLTFAADGDYVPIGVNRFGSVYVETPSGGSISVDDAAGSLTVDVGTALPAGANAIGKLAANSGVDIGDVDVTSIIPGTGATNLGKAEDAAHTTGDTGVMALGVRAAAPTERSAGPTDGDYEPFATNEVGAMWVSNTPSANGGASTMNASSSDGATALTSTAQAIKASAGCLYGYYIYNPNATAQFVQFYNTAAASVTVGTTNPLFMLTIPATSAANLFMDTGIQFSNAGWSWAATATAGGNGAPGTALDAVAWFK